MTDIDRPVSLSEFGDREHKRRDIPDGAFIYRSGDKTFVGYIEQFEVGGTRFRPKLSATFVADSDDNYLYEYRDSPEDQPSVKRDWITRLDGSVYADPPVTDAERETDGGRWIAEARDRGGDWECVGVRRNQFLAMELIGDLDRYDRRIRRDNEYKGHP